MGSASAKGKVHLRSAFAIAGLLALMALVVPAGAEAAKYQYKVTQFDYNAIGNLTGARGSFECEPEYTAGWHGRVETLPSDLAQLDRRGYGDGSLRVGKRGTSGSLTAEMEVDSTMTGESTVVTACEDGQRTDTRTTPCADSAQSKIVANARFKAGVGTQIAILWEFGPPGGNGWVPNVFRCWEALWFEPYNGGAFSCNPAQVPLSSLTKKSSRVPFRCTIQSLTPPVGTDYDLFGTSSIANGFLELKRTRKRG